MSEFSRRNFLGAITALLSILLVGTLAGAQEKATQGKAEIKRSDLKPVIMQYVEKMSQDSKKTTGVEFTAAQKADIASSILTKMEAQNIYAFTDP
jgi:hypothetical protein